jgi:hypothetical protein
MGGGAAQDSTQVEQRRSRGVARRVAALKSIYLLLNEMFGAIAPNTQAAVPAARRRSPTLTTLGRGIQAG